MSSPSARPWVLAETPYQFLKDNAYQLAVLPMGATEPHNLHLPYGTDWYEGTLIGETLCEHAWAQGARPVLLPTMPYGTETNLSRFPLAMNLNPSTLQLVIADLVESVERSGIRKMIILNSHGGNDFKPVLRELATRTNVHLFLCSWYTCLSDVYFEIFTNKEDHAGELETSFMLRYFPHLVAKHSDGSLAADSGATRPFRFEALQKSWVSITRPWHLLTQNSGSGNPHEASPEKGQRLMEVLKARLVPFIVQLCQADIDETFPFENVELK
ncbi:MAG: creatininase family protein [Pirellulaceae bacterium]|nr:creatininase family protein [Pirellulaceae bacterium]